MSFLTANSWSRFRKENRKHTATDSTPLALSRRMASAACPRSTGVSARPWKSTRSGISSVVYGLASRRGFSKKRS